MNRVHGEDKIKTSDFEGTYNNTSIMLSFYVARVSFKFQERKQSSPQRSSEKDSNSLFL